MIMCFHMSVSKEAYYLEERFEAGFFDPGFEPVYHAAAYDHPLLPVISSQDPEHIRRYRWGLIPHWVKDRKGADKLRDMTINARAETLYEKPAFRSSIGKRRCLVIADGFYEWHHHQGKNYPHYIRLKEGEGFAMAGLWDSWEGGKEGGKTFSVITVDANPLMARIHNKKKRMPAILRAEDEKKWLDTELPKSEVEAMLRPFDENQMQARTISKLITARGRDSNVPEVMREHRYEALESRQTRLF